MHPVVPAPASAYVIAPPPDAGVVTLADDGVNVRPDAIVTVVVGVQVITCARSAVLDTVKVTVVDPAAHIPVEAAVAVTGQDPAALAGTVIVFEVLVLIEQIVFTVDVLYVMDPPPEAGVVTLGVVEGMKLVVEAVETMFRVEGVVHVTVCGAAVMYKVNVSPLDAAYKVVAWAVAVT